MGTIKSKSNEGILEVREDPETGEAFIELPPRLLEQMGWKEGDVLEWQQRQDGTWFITKADEEEDDGD
jgi:hypothetical protein